MKILQEGGGALLEEIRYMNKNNPLDLFIIIDLQNKSIENKTNASPKCFSFCFEKRHPRMAHLFNTKIKNLTQLWK